eukprot:TRINITY_DN13016_c0_g1_i1.p1 TRINITY_DN13016_c0_g1~~TRINITY_DN13016_c0_g1_i1.p1  ORF type:complete len:126 (+),score=11.65 TRINITY_DN13016_c0_g1_i1:43-378(+)
MVVSLTCRRTRKFSEKDCRRRRQRPASPGSIQFWLADGSLGRPEFIRMGNMLHCSERPSGHMCSGIALQSHSAAFFVAVQDRLRVAMRSGAVDYNVPRTSLPTERRPLVLL